MDFHNVATKEGKAEALAADVLDDEPQVRLNLDYLLELARSAEAHGLACKTGIRWGMPRSSRWRSTEHCSTRRGQSLK